MIGVTPESVAKFWRDSFTYLQTENFKKVMETQFLDRWAYAEFTGDNKEVERSEKKSTSSTQERSKTRRYYKQQ